MKNKKLPLIILLILIFSIHGYGQNNERTEGQYIDYSTISMAESPTAAALNSVKEIEVNPAKGLPIISIPIYTYEVDGIKVPISLSYDPSGIKVAQLATSVGLGWSLMAGGQISRTVRSKPDEEENNGWYDDGYLRLAYYADKDENDKDWQLDMKGHMVDKYNGLVKQRDHSPDLFSYSFSGYSGTYIHDTEANVFKEKNDGITIYPFNNTEDNLDAYDLNGNHFFFDYDDAETSSNIYTSRTDNDLALDFRDWGLVNGFPIITAWKLSEITTKNNKKIEFDYEDEDMDYETNKENWQVTIGYLCSNTNTTITTASSGSNVHRIFTTKLIENISSPDSDTSVQFVYGTDTGLPNSVWKKKLTKIIISNTETQETREFRFNYTRFSGDPRLKLESVQEVSFENNVLIEKPAYLFEYQTGQLPAKDSNAQDFYGYYNLANNNNGLLPDILVDPLRNQDLHNYTGNRSLNSNGLKRGILKEIVYPTGGKTLFEYEPNVADINAHNGYRGGLRVKMVTNKNELNEDFNKKTFQYSDLKGIDLETQVYQWFFKIEGGTKTYFSHPIRMPGDFFSGYKSGYFYGKVKVFSHNDNPSEVTKTEFNYIQNNSNTQSFDYALASEISYLGTTSNLIKIVEYTNAIVSNSGWGETLDWYIIGDMDCFTIPSGNSYIGYTTDPRKIEYSGNYAYLPIQIATTDFLSPGNKAVTTIKEIEYDTNTLLKTKEIVDTRKTRVVNGNVVSYPQTNSHGERLLTKYEYPWSTGINEPNLPKALPISKRTYKNNENSDLLFGQYFKYDNLGNIQTTFQFNKGEGSNAAGGYIPSDYEQMSSFIYSNGKPVQTLDLHGSPVSYIWGYNHQYPVAKIEGISYSIVSVGGHVSAIQNAIQTAPYNEANVLTALNNLRNAFPKAMITTYTFEPLNGVKTITDPKGDKITYYYDSFGRLEYVKNKDGNRLTENEYNYGSQ